MPEMELQEQLRRALDAERRQRVDLTVALRQLEEAQQIIEQTSRVTQEMEIASRLQTSILPSILATPGLEIAARMRPAAEVGGDYYDVRTVEGACWIGIGDVAGHGLTAGMIMLMLQSIVATLVRVAPEARPAELVTQLNSVLYDNVRRLGRGEFATLSLLRIAHDGSVVTAGAHQDVILRRAGAASCELIRTSGTWVGVASQVREHTPEATWTLNAGDLMVLYTDGVTEAVNADNEQFGVERLAEVIAKAPADASPHAIVEAVFAAVDGFASWCDDDATVLAVRRSES